MDLKLGPAVLFMDMVDRESLQVPDIHTFQVSLKKPYAPFISTIPWLFVVSWKQVMANAVDNDYGQKWLMSNAAGSGPFKIRRWEQGNLYELEARAPTGRLGRAPAHRRLHLQADPGEFVAEDLPPEG